MGSANRWYSCSSQGLHSVGHLPIACLVTVERCPPPPPRSRRPKKLQGLDSTPCHACDQRRSIPKTLALSPRQYVSLKPQSLKSKPCRPHLCSPHLEWRSQEPFQPVLSAVAKSNPHLGSASGFRTSHHITSIQSKSTSPSAYITVQTDAGLRLVQQRRLCTMTLTSMRKPTMMPC